MGAGMNLALAADIRIASHNAFFAQSHVRRGMTSDYGGTHLLPLAVGQSKTMELIYTGATVESEEALHLGIVS
ncbi:enoyl-CoA hydratase/isomerase family protein [Burkholderia multivorans]|nr:enoyl-CoA hydratase/isomerase family protein [Burkholderia multivorans]MBN6733480.1 enoyl-CoA hydratase/isomerase family protein [Burkholderia multivorans]MBN7130382.1 enoyl-CoA hydratase/isomerase family protein [Burkholderia multivorans]MBN8165064.1 enoyl-CoA hydratase/isomerase family protein [Burkholderia multivorans]MBN8170853.1 enoyl-CoA hydratase/isomerase family protein [Burkholderia multivorans]